jgi:hypothetical protein
MTIAAKIGLRLRNLFRSENGALRVLPSYAESLSGGDTHYLDVCRMGALDLRHR